MFQLKPEEKETAMTTVILGKFKWLFIYIYIKNAYLHEWLRLVESCMIFPLQSQYLEQFHTVVNQKLTVSPQK